MRHRFRSKLISAVCFAFLGLTSVAAAHEGEAQEKSATLKHLEETDEAKFDSDFLKSMTHHHHSGIEMAKLAESKAAHAEVRELAKKIDSAQTHESEQMSGWLKSWFKEETHPHFRDEAMEAKMEREMASLKAAKGQDFDKLFLTAMTMHHCDGIAMAKLAEEKGEHDELVKAAKMMVADQSREVDQMTEWKQSWFGKSS